MTKKKATTKRGAKGNAELTPERLRVILEDPTVKERVKDSLTRRVGELYGAARCDSLPNGLALAALEFEEAVSVIQWREEKGRDTTEARAAYARLAAAVERYEPEEYRVARRVRELFAADSDAHSCTAGGRLITEAADSVMESAGEGVMLHSPLSEFFIPFFVKAAREIGRGDRRYISLKKIIARVDAGEDLDEIAEQESKAA
jgi:hypothetical protein